MPRMIVYNAGGGNVYRQMAIDEAMLYHVAYTGEAVGRVYWMKPSAVTIGYFQKLSEAVDMEAVLRLGVDATRRITGGGSVYHDEEGELIYAVAVPVEYVNVPVDESFRILSYPVTCVLRKLGLTPSYEGLNDIIVEGRKVSGNAQVRRAGVVLQHGTLLLDAKYSAMERLLRIPEAKRRESIRERVAGLAQLGLNVDRAYVAALMLSCLRELGERLGFKVEVAEPPLNLGIVAEALEWRYKSREWLMRR